MRLQQPATFEVGISYDVGAPESAGGTYAVKVGSQMLSGTVASSSPKGSVALGRVNLAPGVFEIAVESGKIVGGELFRLRAITLTPATDALRPGTVIGRRRQPPSADASRFDREIAEGATLRPTMAKSASPVTRTQFLEKAEADQSDHQRPGARCRQA